MVLAHNQVPFHTKYGYLIKKLQNYMYDFEELNSLEKGSTKLNDNKEMNLFTISRT